MIRALARMALAAASIATGGAALWALAQNPFAAPMVARSSEQVAFVLERAMAREVTPEWLLPRLEYALDDDDRDRVGMLAELAGRHGIVLASDLTGRVETTLAPPGLAESALDCGRCALDIRVCDSLARIGACAVPFELTPLGDLNALRRQAGAAMVGGEVDRIETGLALLGLGASSLVVVSGGTSASVKLGASGLRAARRMGALTPGFTRVLADAADLPVSGSAVLLRRPLDEVTDAARLGRLGRIADDLATVSRNTSPAETLVLLRHVDTADDAARLARVSDALGPQTRATFEVLGPARVFRALTRVSDLALLTIGLLAALAVQIGGLVLSLALRSAQRLVR
jgi:hypothetical protein